MKTASHTTTFSVKTKSPSGFVAYLSHKGKKAWSKKTALKYMRDFVSTFGGTAELEQE